MKKRFNWKVLVVCFLVVGFVAFVGSLFTSKSVNSEWYNQIKPSITPPNFVFPVVWTALFILIAVSLYYAWMSSKNKKLLACVYGLNFDLNMLWSFLYFGIKNPAAAFYQIIILWISIVLMIYYVRKIDKRAAWLLVPYLLWVSFAGVLNFLSI